MNRRTLLKKTALLSPAALLPACSTVAQLALQQQYLISTNQILSQLLPRFPFQQNLQNIGTLSLANPVFQMAPDINKIRIGLTTSAQASNALGALTGIPALGQLAGKSTSGTCQLACGLRYDSATRGIFLKEPQLEKFDLQNISPTLTNPLKSLINTFGPQLLDRHPIHTLEPNLASRFLNNFQIQQNGIALKFAP